MWLAEPSDHRSRIHQQRWGLSQKPRNTCFETYNMLPEWLLCDVKSNPTLDKRGKLGRIWERPLHQCVDLRVFAYGSGMEEAPNSDGSFDRRSMDLVCYGPP